VLQQGISGHYLPRSAETALDCAMLDESLLQGMQALCIIRGGVSQTLDGEHLLAVGSGSRVRARKHRLTIHENGTSAALGFVAADFQAFQIQALAQQICQRLAIQAGKGYWLAVHHQLNQIRLGHTQRSLHVIKIPFDQSA
jgi:hypothetical protein